MSVPKQEKQLKKKCLLPDDGANVNAAITARGNLIFPWIFWRLIFSFSKINIFIKTLLFKKKIGAKQLGSIVAAAKAQALAEQIGVDESRRSFARLVKTNKRNKNKTKILV